MDLLTLKLLSAAVAGALLVVIFLVIRQVLTRRRPKVPFDSPPAAASMRKRQLRPVSELDEDEEDDILPPPVEAAEPFVAAPRAPVEPEPTPMPEPEPEPELAPHPQPEASFSAGVLARLEQAFERLQGGAITLREYVLEVQGEQADVDAHLTALYTRDADPAVIDDAIAAQDAVRWCLDWARDQETPQT